MSLTARLSAKSSLRVLTLDIERLPGLARVWEPRTKYISPRQFVEWPRLLCVAARWYGEKTPLFASVWDDGHEGTLRAVHGLVSEADTVVTFNGVRFDMPKLKGDWLAAGMPPPKPWKDVDLYRIVRAQFGFESNSLDSVTRRLGLAGKSMHYSMDLAQQAAYGDPDDPATRKARATMRKYNINDVIQTEALYDRLRGYIPGHPHPVPGDLVCNQCGSDKLRRDGRYRAVVIDYALYQCTKCGGWVRGSWQGRAAQTRGVK